MNAIVVVADRCDPFSTYHCPVATLRRLLTIAFIAAAALWSAVASPAQSPVPSVDVVEVSGPIDRTLVDYVEAAIRDSDAQLVVLSVNAPAAIDTDVVGLMELIADSSVPVAVWIGPAPATVRGGAHGQIRAPAP